MPVALDSPVGIVPAAGFARRLQPLSSSKEVCLIGGRPIIDYLLERMDVAGCTEIRVITRPEKQDVADHASTRGAAVLFARPATVSESLLAGLHDLAPETPVVFGFPDTLWQPRDGFTRLLAALRPGVDVVLGIFRAEAPSRSDVVTLAGDRVTTIRVKPEQPSSDLVWGCAASRAGVLRALRGHAEPGLYFDQLARRGRVLGIRLSDPFIDIGTPDSLERARAAAHAAGSDSDELVSDEDAG
jgi:glucose-1-phosphate thymidylyltransferase